MNSHPKVCMKVLHELLDCHVKGAEVMHEWLAILKLLSPGVPSDLITCVYMRWIMF